MKLLIAVAVLAGLAVVGAEDTYYPPILDPSAHTQWTGASLDQLSRRADILVPFVNATGSDDQVDLIRLDLVGNATQRGRSHGQLVAKEAFHLIKIALPKWYESMIFSFDRSVLPSWLADILKVKVASRAAQAFNKALGALYSYQEPFIPARLIDEMEGIAMGICDTLGEDCDVEYWTQQIKQVNMLPELIRMTCTMFGAWGNASASSSLIQLRALDFGASPFANYSVLQVHRPTDGSAAFASLSFPGLVGVITGINERGVGLSEKVWEVDNTTTGLQPGTYEGEAVVMVSRDVIELAKNREDAETYMRQANRTWSVFLGIGDYETQKMDICGYREADFHAYTPETMPAVTSMPYYEDLVYVDKHPQPSTDPTLPTLLGNFYGNLTIETTRMIAQDHTTGDVHIAVYDYGARTMWLSVGRIDANGDFVDPNWKACGRPYLTFDLDTLWNGSI